MPTKKCSDTKTARMLWQRICDGLRYRVYVDLPGALHILQLHDTGDLYHLLLQRNYSWRKACAAESVWYLRGSPRPTTHSARIMTAQNQTAGSCTSMRIISTVGLWSSYWIAGGRVPMGQPRARWSVGHPRWRTSRIRAGSRSRPSGATTRCP